MLDQFEEAWRSGPAPRLEAYLPPTNHAMRRHVLEGLIKIDLNYRWSQAARSTAGRIDWSAPRQDDAAAPSLGSASQQYRLEDYVQRFPELGRLDQVGLELVQEEYWVRCRWGDRPSHADYLARFPGHDTQLRSTLAAIDAELTADAARPSGTGAASVDSPPASAGPAPVAAAAPTLADLVKFLQTAPLMSSAQQQELGRSLQQRFSDPRMLAKELLQRGWLSPYQVNQLLQGRGQDLLLGPYILLERLGEGGVGQVFKARHQRMNRIVALKVIRKELLAEPEVVSRFYREIQVVSKLTHPHVVHAYDAGPIGSNHVLVMEYVDGIDLARLVKQSGPLPVVEACEYIRQTALGLQHAHERGLVHRDIKPPNLLVSGAAVSGGAPGATTPSPRPPQQIKILDLGLARLQQIADHRHAGESANSLVTPQGSLMMGTPDYLAPEQALDFHAADIRADIYSLGCTFTCLLTGQPPFSGGTLAQKVAKHMQAEPPAIEEVRPDVTPALGRIIRRMLAKRPEDRYQTPREVADALAAFTAAPPAQATARGKRRWLARILGGILILAAAGFGVFSLFRPQASPPSDRKSVDGDRSVLSPLDRLDIKKTPEASLPSQRPDELIAVLGEPRTGPHNSQFRVAFAPSSWLLASASEGRPLRLWNFAGPGPPELRELKGHHYSVAALAFAPDGRTLASGGADKTIRLWDLASNPPGPAMVCQVDTPVAGLAFHPNGRMLASVCQSEKEIGLWELSGTPLHKATRVDTIPLDTPGLALSFAADGKTLVCGTIGQKVVAFDLSGAKPVERGSVPTGSSVSIVAFSPDGKRLAFVAYGTLWLGEWTGAKPKKLHDLRHRGRVHAFAFAANSATLVTADSERWIAVWEVGTGKRVREFQVADEILRLSVAADSRHLATANSNGTVSLYRLAPGAP
jgi:serine/threonine-protein kinase